MDGPASPVDGIPDLAVRLLTVAAPWIVLLSLPAFYTGIWVQVEGPVAALHLISGGILAGLGVLVLRNHAGAARAVRHPFAVLPWLLALLSFALLPFSPVPALSIHGLPEHGMGIVALLDLGALSAGALYTLERRGWRWLCAASAGIVITGVFVLDQLFRAQRSWAPFFFGDYLAFYAVFGGVFLAAMLGAGRAVWAGLLVALAGLIGLSGNKAALLAMVLAILLVFPLARWIRDARRLPLAFVAALFPLLMTAVIFFAGSGFDEDYRLSMGEIAPLRPLANLIVSTWASMWSRAMLSGIVFWEIADHPAILLFGDGWGHFNESLLRNLTRIGGRLHELIGESKIYWDAVQRSDFHSHNRWVESLLATGSLGLVLALAQLAALPFCARRDLLGLAVFLALLLGTLQAFWFQMPVSLPLMALAMAALARPGRAFPRPRAGRRTAAGACWAAALLLVAAGASAYAMSFQARAKLQDTGEKVAHCETFAFDNGLGEIHRMRLMQNAYARMLDVRATKGRLTAADMGRLKARLCLQPAGGAGFRSLAMKVALNNVIAGLVFRTPELAGETEAIRRHWPRLVGEILAAAPRRSDLAIPYFNHILARGEEDLVLDLASRLLRVDGGDPVGLWFSGVVLLARPGDQKTGIARLKRSLERGIRNLMPVPLAMELLIDPSRPAIRPFNRL